MANTTTDVQQTRDRVVQLARQIEELSGSNIPPSKFFQQFLELLVSALGAQAGAVWMLEEGNRVKLSADVRLKEAGFHDNPRANQTNQKLLSDLVATGEACTYSPEDTTNVQLPTNHLIVLAALHSNKGTAGVVEIFQRPDAPKEARPGYLQFVEQMCGYASRYLDRQNEEEQSSEVVASKFWESFEQFVLQLQRSLDVHEVCDTATNESRLLLGCDRVSVAIQRGKKTSVQSISGQDTVNPRANLVRAMVGISSHVIAMGETLTYTGRVDELPPQIEEPLANFIQESGSRMLMVVPLFETDPLVDKDEDPEALKQPERPRKVIGCLLIEQVAESRPQTGLEQKVELVADHVAAALTNARRYQRIFLLSLWQFLGNCKEWFHGRKLAKTVGVLGGMAALVLGLTFIPWQYRVEGQGELMPVTQREVFAPWEGEVVAIYVKSGSRVDQGDKLVKLRNDELQSRLVEVRNQLNAKRKRMLALQAEWDQLSSSAAEARERIRLEGRLLETNIEIKGLGDEKEILEKRLAKLTVRAPIEGVVATFQLEKMLDDRPVRRGEVLMEVMDETGEWQLELEVEEKRMGHILEEQEQRRQRGLENWKNLPVEFILATATQLTFEGHVTEMATRAAPSKEQGNVVEVFASVDEEELPAHRIGAGVRAKIGCGPRSLGYVLFGDVIEFVRKTFWI